MIGRVEFNTVYGSQKTQDKNGGFQGISPQFFGPSNSIDQKMDAQLSSQLGINTNGMDRNEIKANILASLTGQSVQQMQAFFTNFSDQANKQDVQMLKNSGIEPSGNPNYMQSMAENKAMIVNMMINDNMTQNNIQGTQSSTQTQEAQKANQAQEGPPPEILQMLQQLGLQPTGSLEGDMAAIQQKLQEIQAQGASQSNQAQGAEKAQGQGQGGGSTPELSSAIQSIMSAVGVSPSGNLNTDYSNVMNKIQNMILSATDEGQKQQAQMLLSVAQTAFSGN